MTQAMFSPRLSLSAGTTEPVALRSYVTVPSGHYSALPALLAPPTGVAVVPELFPVTLPLGYAKGLATQALTLVSHDPIDLVGLTDAHEHVVAFVTLDDRVLGVGSIGAPLFTFGAAFDRSAKARSAAAFELDAASWKAWVDNMPIGPRSLHVKGTVMVPNPGIVVDLQRVIPPGINPSILLLELREQQLPGNWPQVVVFKSVEYTEGVYTDHHDSIGIVMGNHQIASVDVEQVH